MDKPEKVEEVWPHTETVLFLTDSNTCFGDPVSDVMDEISNCIHLEDGDRHKDNGLSADFHRFNQCRVEDVNEIVPNSLIFAHCNFIIETDLWIYLQGGSLPSGSEIVFLKDGPVYEEAEERIENIPCSVETASCKEDVLEEAKRYFNRICPECQGDPARNWVLKWQQQVYQEVHD